MDIATSGAKPQILLTAAQKRALDRLCRNIYRRDRGGWSTPGDKAISLGVASELAMRDLAVIRHGAGRPVLSATGLGLELRERIRVARATKLKDGAKKETVQ